MEINGILNEFNIDKGVLSTEDLHQKYLGRKGLINQLFQQITSVPVEARQARGKEVNAFKQQIETFVNSCEKSVTPNDQLIFDISRPICKFDRGTMHPIMIIVKQMIKIFEGMGFETIQDTEFTTVDYCFNRLRTPEWHPARDVQDTFYLKNSSEILLRTQTTATQPKILDTHKPPLRIISVGKVFRSDAMDATHTPMFYNFDGFMVDKNISVANLKAILASFVRQFLPNVKKLRFRPHYFGYTEPSIELDIQCGICGGTGCKACKNRGWIEVLGSGMMHQELFTNAGYAWNEFTGFAFGLGVDRFVMQRYNIPDIRYLYENDMRLLKQIIR